MSRRPFLDAATRRWWHAALLLVASAACSHPPGGPAPAAAPVTTVPPPSTTTAATAAPAAPTTTTTAEPTVPIPYRIERHATDPATADFASVVEATLSDARGWSRAGFRMTRIDAAPYLVVLAEPAEAERLCRPYDVFSKYSCQIGPTVVINADRWRHATPEWTGDLPTYKQMLVDHEFGHLLGMKHPKPQCPVPGQPARVMSQQSTDLDGCRPNPWPLPDEIARAAQHDLPLAPGYEPG